MTLSRFEEFTSLLNDSSLYEEILKELPEELRPEKRIKLDEASRYFFEATMTCNHTIVLFYFYLRPKADRS